MFLRLFIVTIAKWAGLGTTLLASGASLKEVVFGDYKDVEKSVNLVLFQDCIQHSDI